MSDARPRISDGRFQLVEQTGGGAIATVWRALDLESGRPVAIKVMRTETMDLEDIQRLAQEVEILRRLDHPCIVKLHGTGVAEEGNPYVVMEWIDGIDLRHRLDQEPTLRLEDVRDIIGQICSALTEAHGQGVIHRDLKPENVLLCAPEHIAVKLVDFGMAKVLGPGAPSLTLNNAIFGTPQYMAPERARGMAVTAAADVYALGVVAFEMLVGRRPFDGRTSLEVLTQHLRSEVPAMGCSPAVESVVRQALAKQPEDRPTVRELAQRLGEALTAD